MARVHGAISRKTTRALGSTTAGLTAAIATVIGVAGMATLVACAQPADEKPDVFLISLDTVRRDHLSMYGYARDTAPFIDRMARDALVFEEAFAQDTNTNPSHTSMFTGLYPPAHGSVANGVPLGADQVTLAQILRDAGYRTGGFVSGATLQDKACGLSRGFDQYDDDFPGLRRDGRETAERAGQWLRESTDQPTFLFLHLYDAHGPYLPTGDFTGLFTSKEPGPDVRDIPDYQRVPDETGRLPRNVHWYVDRYDAMIRYADDCVRRLLEDVNLDESIVIVLSDHGETFHERYGSLGHGAEVYDEQTRIPLLIRAPGLEAARVNGFTETVDLVPTLMGLLGLPEPAGTQGRSLLPSDSDDSIDREFVYASARAAQSHYADREYQLDRARRIHSLRSAQWKLILYPGRESDYVELYDLAADPGEQNDVSETHSPLSREFLEQLTAWAEQSPHSADLAEIDPSVRGKLESLGYVGD